MKTRQNSRFPHCRVRSPSMDCFSDTSDMKSSPTAADLTKICSQKSDLDLKPVKHGCPAATSADLSDWPELIGYEVNTHQVWCIMVYLSRDSSGLQKWADRLWRWLCTHNWLDLCDVPLHSPVLMPSIFLLAAFGRGLSVNPDPAPPSAPHEGPHQVSQLRFDLLTSLKLSDTFSIGLRARGQLNRLAGEIGLIREGNGEGGVTPGVSHSQCTASADGVRLSSIGGFDVEKRAHINCYRRALHVWPTWLHCS